MSKRRTIIRREEAKEVLSTRWYKLRPNPGGMAYARSPHRFNVVPAGRRSGKTERAKRKLVLRALDTSTLKHDQAPRFFAGAPTRTQAKQIYWEDLKQLTKPWWDQEPMETDLMIKLITGAEILVFGMDKPQRFEGQPWDGGVLDEYADMKETAWSLNVRPALSDRDGWCDLIGVPEGRNHYYKTFKKAQARMMERGARSQWGAYTWFSSEVLSAEEIEAAKEDMDELSFQQEYEASFLNFEGRAYYGFNEFNVRPVRALYNPFAPLVLMFDFNVQPGVAAIGQLVKIKDLTVFAVMGEVWIPNNSNTEIVCRKILLDWGMHQGPVQAYGDATGGSRGTAKTSGSDWDIVKAYMTKGDPSRELKGFGARFSLQVPPANPSERARVNSVNARICTMQGVRRLLVDPVHAPHVVEDFEGVRLVEGGSGEIDKKINLNLTHISDAVGYFIHAAFPLAQPGASMRVLTA